jgi:hypothetical protein
MFVTGGKPIYVLDTSPTYNLLQPG